MIFWRPRLSMNSHLLESDTATGVNARLLKMVTSNCGIIPAFTNTVPVSSFVGSGATYNAKSSMDFSGAIDKIVCRHSDSYLGFK